MYCYVANVRCTSLHTTYLQHHHSTEVQCNTIIYNEASQVLEPPTAHSRRSQCSIQKSLSAAVGVFPPTEIETIDGLFCIEMCIEMCIIIAMTNAHQLSRSRWTRTAQYQPCNIKHQLAHSMPTLYTLCTARLCWINKSDRYCESTPAG